ncbi:MAG: hypothetical protein SGPRY_006267 [Prymnesium sp.]
MPALMSPLFRQADVAISCVFLSVVRQRVVRHRVVRQWVVSQREHLLEEDDGTTLPEAASGHDGDSSILQASLHWTEEETKKWREETLSSLLPAVPYRWVQPLGLPSNTLVLSSTLSAIGERVLARLALSEQLSRLARCDTSMPPGVRAMPLPPKPLATTLSHWTSLQEEEAVGGQAARNSTPGRASFRATFVHGETVLLATVSIFADFPTTRPQVSLAWSAPPPRVRQGAPGPPPALRELAKPNALKIAAMFKGEAFDNHLLHMEAELNVLSARSADVDPLYSLSAVVLRLRMLLDVYMATEGGENPPSLIGRGLIAVISAEIEGCLPCLPSRLNVGVKTD